MNIFTLKQLRIWLQTATIVVLLITACSPSDVPFDSKPVDIQSAENLARSIARAANCGGFEDNSYKSDISFTCQKITGKEINGQDTMFGIHVFYDETQRNSVAAELSDLSASPFKMGAFYIVSAFQSVGEDGVTIIEPTVQEYAGFPGEIYTPQKSKKN